MLSRPLPDLVAAFENATLARDEWTHEAHLGVALTFCHTGGEERALERMRAGIQRYNAATGVADGPMSGYHETLTVFWVHMVAKFVGQHSGEPEEIFPRLLERWGDPRAPLRFYSKRLLMNPTARARLMAPDLAPLDG
ncbi:hypothetical protein IAD21_02181 [Abditibacteriota bacterium]|nr:hypothetical protein IAD21_02181 [Abditibacteriota bacterium]